MNAECPLCGATRLRVQDTVSVNALRDLYCRAYGPEVGSEFGEVQELSLCVCEVCDLRSFLPPLVGSASFYKVLQREPWYYLQEKPEYEIARRYISPGTRVLEVGSGKGAFGKMIPQAKYQGLELSPEAVEMARTAGVDVVVRSVEDHAREHPAAHDVVCSFQVLEHVPRVRGFLDACVDSLRAGGLLILSVPSEDTWVSVQPNAALNMPPHHVTRWTDESLRSLARLLALELVALEHETLWECHREAYAIALLYAGMNRALGRKMKMIDTSLSHRVIWSIACRVGRRLAPALEDQRLCPYGHSVTVVLRKPCDSVAGDSAGSPATSSEIPKGANRV